MSDTNEDAIRAWRASHAPSEERDAREQQLREELDALAEVGLSGPDAFAHAASKVAAPRDARWRWPAILFFGGVLVHLLGAAGRSLLESSARIVGTGLGVGVLVGQVAQVLVLVVPPLLGIAGVLRFAPKLTGPLPALRPSVRVGLAVSLGLFVLVANHFPFPSSLRRLDAEALRSLNAWHAIAAPTYRLVWRLLPFVLALALVVVRRRSLRVSPDKAAAFWMLAGLLVFDVVGNVSSSSTLLAMHVGHHFVLGPRATFNAALIVTLAVPALLAMLSCFVARRLPGPQVILRSRLTDVLAIGLALASLPFVFRWHLWPVPMREFWIMESASHAHSCAAAAFDVMAPALLGALVGHLRNPR